MKRFVLFCLTVLFVLAAQALEIGLTYRIVSKKFPSKSLFVVDSQREANVDVVLWTETNVPSQQWKLISASNGQYALQNVYASMFAASRSKAEGGTLCTNSSRTSSRLVIEVVDEATGLCHIKPSSGALNLCAKTGEDGELLAWAQPDGEDEGQLWVFETVTPKGTFDEALRDELMDDYLSHHLQQKGSAYRTFGNGGWGEAEQLEVLLDAYESTGRERYLTAAKQVYSYFNSKVGSDWTGGASEGYHWYGYDYNDDVMWQIIAVARLGWLTGKSTYTKAARENFDRIYQRAYIPFTGMMRWAEQTGDRYSTNSCIQGSTEVAACYLAMSGCGEEYFEKARDIYAAQRRFLAQSMLTGQIWDNVVWDPETQKVKSKNEWASTYNQGTMLGAACLLYMHYGESEYLSDARKIMSYTKSNLCNSYGIIKVCQDETNGDLCGFKGILMRYVRRFVLDLNQPSYREWMLRNALLAYSNRNADGLTGTGWLKKATAESTTNPFGCSTAASAAVNAVLGNVVKNGFETLQAEAFDYHCGLLVTDEGSSHGTPIIQVANGYWAQYDNVDFGQQTARSISLLASFPSGAASGSIEVYFDKMEGTPAGVIELKDIEASADWLTLAADIAPTTGCHHVFLRFTYATSRSKAYSIDYLQFSTLTIDEQTSVQRPTADGETSYYTLSGIQLPCSPKRGTCVVRRAGKSSLVHFQ